LEAKWRHAVLQPADLRAAGRYQSQFNDTTNRAHAGQARLKSKLIADLDPDEWDLPPKLWTRWATYNRHVARYDRYDGNFKYGCVTLAAKLGKNFFL
jgi:hypothetical protein